LEYDRVIIGTTGEKHCRIKGEGIMDILITDFISGIDFGEVQSFKNLQIIPLFREGEESLLYLT